MQYSSQSYKRVQYYQEEFVPPFGSVCAHPQLSDGNQFSPNSHSQIQVLQQQIAELQMKLEKLSKYLHVDDSSSPRIIIAGANLQIINGADTEVPNGLGNVIIGMNSPRKNTLLSDRSGSHNLILGNRHHYTGSNSIIFGARNNSQGDSSILGGFKNTCASEFSSLLSGCYNKASGWNSMIFGGWRKRTKHQTTLCYDEASIK